jgi:hypothetical protein
VARLGEFMTVLELFTLGIFGGFLSPQVWLCINFDKKCLGYILGDFFDKLVWSH